MDTRRTLFAAAVVCACHVCGAWAQTADVRIDLTQAGLAIAPVELHGAVPRHFVIDTGATTTMLDARFATALGLAATGTLRIVAASGALSAASGVAADVTIGGLSFDRLPVSWTSLDTLRTEDRRIMGVIGQDVLSRITVTIDYSRRRLRLGTEPCLPGDAVAGTGRADGRPAIAARVRSMGDARDVRLVIDSGANALVLFDSSAGEGRAATGGIPLATHAGEASASVVPRARVTIAGVAVDGPAVVIRPAEPRQEDGLLPASWFSHVCVDGPRSTAVLSR